MHGEQDKSNNQSITGGATLEGYTTSLVPAFPGFVLPNRVLYENRLHVQRTGSGIYRVISQSITAQNLSHMWVKLPSPSAGAALTGPVLLFLGKIPVLASSSVARMAIPDSSRLTHPAEAFRPLSY